MCSNGNWITGLTIAWFMTLRKERDCVNAVSITQSSGIDLTLWNSLFVASHGVVVASFR